MMPTTSYTPSPDAVNRDALYRQAHDALAANKGFLDKASPTNLENAAQAKALTRQMNGIIRLLLNQLDGVD